ncbi:glycoside hydrolase family 99-like domain-containing protein [Halomonas sp. Bachu 37]|uniref:glycoside hydrolase family 99-like domain-containing protein n=1 Tax=Halomonas kashgarensis TaxID=3084920 RepID=UPI003217B980
MKQKIDKKPLLNQKTKPIKKTFLQKANQAFREKKYSEALSFYKKTINNNPYLEKIVKKNIDLTIKKLRKDPPSSTSNEPIISAEKNIEFKSKKKYYQNFSEAFDPNYYLHLYPDVKEAGVDPEQHYRNWGWKEFRRPNKWFDPEHYLATYKEVAKEEVEPLGHYITEGIKRNYHTRNFCTPKKNKKQLALIDKIKFDDINEGYTSYQESDSHELAVKVIAFYLPQFHPFPENDAWWGKGFTEWTNVTKAQPNFEGHYQPHLPIHNGFYDLRIPEVMLEQAKLAKNYGVYGFNFYYYWFDGKVLMHKPFEILLKHKEIDIPFCITWANENWTRRWDGAENDILIGQNHCEEDSIKFIENLYKFFDDERYIRINNKPLLIIYRANIIPQMEETIKLWRSKAKEAGYDDLYIVCAQTFGLKSPDEFGFDAAMEFPPHTANSREISDTKKINNKKYRGRIYDYEQVVENSIKTVEPDFKLFRTCMLSWDNTARKQDNSHIFSNFSLLRYKQWISNIAINSYNNPKYRKDEKIIFVNAWNEWAEGTHLEPDRKHGYGYLQTTYDAIKNCSLDFLDTLNKPFNKHKNYAVILHIHYTDIWEDINRYLKNLNFAGFDIYITVTSLNNNIVHKIKEEYPLATIRLVENRGRDILPFINTYSKIKELGYKAICKVHSKKSIYRGDGDIIRDEVYEGLLGSEEIIKKNLLELECPTSNGVFCPKKYLIPHTEHNMTYDQETVDELCALLNINFNYSYFPAGSMYWFKPKALNGLEKIKPEFFDLENGLTDGTLAHAIERIISLLATNNHMPEVYHEL